MLQRLRTFLKYLTCDIWHEDLNTLNKKRVRSIRTLRIFMLIGEGYAKDQCVLHAASLTFISLLSFVPVLTICFIFANAMGATERLHEETKDFIKRIAEAPIPLEKELTKLTNADMVMATTNNVEAISIVNASTGVLPQTELSMPVSSGSIAVQSSVATNSNDNLDLALVSEVSTPQNAACFGGQSSNHTNGVVTVDTINELIDVAFEKINGINYKALGVVGFIFFAWTVFSLLEKIELAFNAVWKQKKSRPILIKLRDYSVVLFIVPALCVLAFLIPLLNLLINNITKYDGGFFAGLINNSFTRFIMIAGLLMIAFAIIHKAIPYAKVRFKAALYGGAFTTVAFVLWLKFCLSFQVGVAKYSAAFGSFAIVPIILFWVYISWQIILFGAEITHAVQNWKDYKPEGNV